MFPDLPEHLQALNTIPGDTPPSGMNAEQEEAFWGFLHADELFRNFGSAPSPNDHLHEEEKRKASVAASMPVVPAAPSTAKDPKPTLESFLAAYIGEQAQPEQPQAQPNSYRSTAQTIEDFLMPLPTPYSAPASLPMPNSAHSIAPTPMSISTMEVMPVAGSSDVSESPYSEDKPSGAKKLKQIGAQPGEIEEDKRRRNTEASARFRAKKKEREQAVERRAKDLEAKVAQLAAENTSLQNENRLLKAIVLNGAHTSNSLPSGGQDSQDLLHAALATVGKRKRDE